MYCNTKNAVVQVVMVLQAKEGLSRQHTHYGRKDGSPIQASSSSGPGVKCPFAAFIRAKILAGVLPDFSVDPVSPLLFLLFFLMSKLSASCSSDCRLPDTKGEK